MARFRGFVKGSRGGASRLGGAASGLFVSANGWDVGVDVEAAADGDTDRLNVYATGGSNGGTRRLIATVERDGINFHNRMGD